MNQTNHDTTVSRSPLPAQQLASASTVEDAMAGMMSLAEGLFPFQRQGSKLGVGGGRGARQLSGTPNSRGGSPGLVCNVHLFLCGPE